MVATEGDNGHSNGSNGVNSDDNHTGVCRRLCVGLVLTIGGDGVLLAWIDDRVSVTIGNELLFVWTSDKVSVAIETAVAVGPSLVCSVLSGQVSGRLSAHPWASPLLSGTPCLSRDCTDLVGSV